jgi:CBS domain containing-hemolysin-like protein
MPSVLSRASAAALAAISVLVLVYSTIIAQQLLLGFLAVGAVWFVYMLYVLVVILARIATALEELVDQRAESAHER